jgi:hypothetical protein
MPQSQTTLDCGFAKGRPCLDGQADQPPLEPRRCLHYSVGMTITDEMTEAILALPDRVWEPAYDAGGQVRPGAWVAELTGLLDLAAGRR